jgi:hypothetical protein
MYSTGVVVDLVLEEANIYIYEITCPRAAAGL